MKYSRRETHGDRIFYALVNIAMGMLLLMLGNGLQGTLLGIRGDLEGFSTSERSVVMSAYYAGFLVASRVTPRMLRRVGHVRVFAALGSFISAVGMPVMPAPEVWPLPLVFTQP